MGTISVIIPTYNRAHTLERAIDSALNQTYDDFEIIVVDDCSTDNTSEIVHAYDDKRITYIRSNSNKGANHARNIGISHADGEYISFLDSDDQLHKRYHEVCLDVINKCASDCGGVFTSIDLYRDGKLYNVKSAPEKKITQNDVCDGNIIGGFSGTIFKSGIFDTIGKLDETLETSQDYDFYIRVLEHYSLVGIDEPLVNYYLHGDNISVNIEKKEQGNRKIIEKHKDIISNKRISAQLFSEGLHHGLDGNLTIARKRFKCSIQQNKYNILSYYFYVSTLFNKRVFELVVYLSITIRSYMYKIKMNTYR